LLFLPGKTLSNREAREEREVEELFWLFGSLRVFPHYGECTIVKKTGSFC
jgi:hypothetical protein